MQDFSQRLANLSSEQREILLRLLQEPADAPPDARGSGFPRLKLRPENRYDPFPLTEIQRVYWAGRSGLFDLGTCGTNLYTELEVSGFSEPPLELVESVVRRLIERHEMLRSVLLADGRQRILREVPPYRVRIEDLREYPDEVIEESLRVPRVEMRYPPKPVDRWPLFDVMVQLLPGGRLRLHMSFQTFLIDGTGRLKILAEVTGMLQNPGLVLDPVECSYRDYSLLWEEFRESDLYKRSQAYWLGKLPAMAPAPRLPYTVPVSPETSTRFVNRSRAFTSGEWQELKARAARFGLTPSSAIIAAFVEVLALWSREARFTLFLPSTYYPPVHPGIEAILGNFNTSILLPVQRWFGDFASRAAKIQEEVQNGLDHQYFSGFEVIREINRRKGGTSAAACPVLINSVIEYNQQSYRKKLELKGSSNRESQGTGLKVGQTDVGIGIPEFILIVTVFELSNETMALSWQCVEEVLPAAISSEMFDAFCALIQRLLTDDSAWRVKRWESARSLLPERQRQQRALLNATRGDEAGVFLQERFFEVARLHPQRPAVVEKGGSISYGELAERALRIGREVRRLHGRSRLVGVLADSRIEASAAILGILSAGSPFIVVPPGASQLIRDYGFDLLVAESAAEERTGKIAGVTVVSTDAPEGEGEIEQHGEPSSLAYVALDLIDGESVRLRGSMVEHRAALNSTRDLAQRLGLSGECRWVAATGLECSRFNLELFTALGAGATILFPDASDLRDPARLTEWLIRERAEVWSSGPAMFESVVAELEALPGRSLESLRLAILHGGPVAVNLPSRLAGLIAELRMVILDPVPETGGYSLFEQADGGADLGPGYLRGLPAANQSAYVLNDELEDCPDRVVGELYLGGATLGKGYWNDEDATLSRFILHPRTGERLLRSGKLARVLPEGLVELLGAPCDVEGETIGYCVELRLVEAALERHTLVRTAVVLAEEGMGRRNRLVAHVVRRRGAALQEEDLRKWLRGSLPYYMIPARFSIHDALPFTGDGSVDRRALRRIPRNSPDGHAAGVCGPVETELASIWREVLGREEIGCQDDFFAIGGDSIKLVQMLSRVQRLSGCEGRLWQFFQEPTIEHLARQLSREEQRTLLGKQELT